MRDLMEHYGKLKGGLEACKGNIRRMKSSTFDEYILDGKNLDIA